MVHDYSLHSFQERNLFKTIKQRRVVQIAKCFKHLEMAAHSIDFPFSAGSLQIC